MRHASALRLALAAALLALSLAFSCPGPSGLRAVRIAFGFSSPVFVTAPEGDPRLFVVERGGRIKILDANRTPVAIPFLDISELTNGVNEQGLLGLRFAPDYATSGVFYISYTDLFGTSILARYRVSAGNPDRADASSAELLMQVAQPRANHNGGHIEFGPDGMLLWGIGDGGGPGDPDENAQNLSNRLGTILRIDVSGGLGSGYAIPSDNPFRAADDGIPDEIWAYGLRNPYRFSVDRFRRLLFIGDVGQDRLEELDIQRFADSAGSNYGWDLREGTLCFDAPPPCGGSAVVDPVFEYDHGFDRCSIVDGVTHYGSIAETWSLHFFADFCSGDVWTAEIMADADGRVMITELRLRTAELAHESGTLDNPAGFGLGGDGTLYVVDLDGELYQIVSAREAP